MMAIIGMVILDDLTGGARDRLGPVLGLAVARVRVDELQPSWRTAARPGWRSSASSSGTTRRTAPGVDWASYSDSPLRAFEMDVSAAKVSNGYLAMMAIFGCVAMMAIIGAFILHDRTGRTWGRVGLVLGLAAARIQEE